MWQDQLQRTSIRTSVSSLSDIDADPVIDSGQVFAIGAGGRMVALDIVSGQRMWELNIAGIATPWVAGDWVFVVTDDAKLLCIYRQNGHIRWINQLPQFEKRQVEEGRHRLFGAGARRQPADPHRLERAGDPDRSGDGQLPFAVQCRDARSACRRWSPRSTLYIYDDQAGCTHIVDRHCERSEAIQRTSGLPRRLRLLAMTEVFV